MRLINLNNLQGIPNELVEKLSNNHQAFLETDSLDNLLEVEEVWNAMVKIDEYCRKGQIIGFHYTRAIPEILIKSGLICRTGKEIRSTFLRDYGNSFTDQEQTTILKKWDDHFDKQQQSSRDNYLFFNFTTSALYDHGAESLLTNFGGEQVYMPIFELDSISTKIKNLGTPMILKCRLDPNHINTFYEYPWGKIAVSSFHAMCNDEACRIDQDGYQSVNVKPSEIEILYYDNYIDFRQI